MIATAMIQGAHLSGWQHRRLNGDEFPATVSLTRLDLAGQPVLQAAIHDITAIRKQEQEQELILSRTKPRELIAHREEVREDERVCIAHELHDDLSQYLTALRRRSICSTCGSHRRMAN